MNDVPVTLFEIVGMLVTDTVELADDKILPESIGDIECFVDGLKFAELDTLLDALFSTLPESDTVTVVIIDEECVLETDAPPLTVSNAVDDDKIVAETQEDTEVVTDGDTVLLIDIEFDTVFVTETLHCEDKVIVGEGETEIVDDVLTLGVPLAQPVKVDETDAERVTDPDADTVAVPAIESL
jgi:hypothetical protein